MPKHPFITASADGFILVKYVIIIIIIIIFCSSLSLVPFVTPFSSVPPCSLLSHIPLFPLFSNAPYVPILPLFLLFPLVPPCFNFILGFNFIFFCFKHLIVHFHTQRQGRIKLKLRMKLNHNTYILLSL